MMQLSSIETLDWVNPKDFNQDNYSKGTPIVCFLEVDLGYHDEFLDLHDYLLPSERIKVTEEMLSKYQLPFKKDNNFSRRKIKKIIPNLGPIKKNTNSTAKT